jgi:hypothetical protein
VCPIEHTITLPFYAVLDFDESSSWVEDGKIYIAYADENNPDGYLYDEQSIHNQVKAKLSETMSPHYDIIQTTKQIYIVFYCVEECPYLSGIGQRYRDMLKSCTEIRADREDFKMVIKAVVDALKKEK